MASDFFEPISAEEFRRETAIGSATPRGSAKTKKLKLEPRLETTWFALPTFQGECTMAAHDDVQQMLPPEKQAYREQYKIVGKLRYVFEVREGEYMCRDCFLAEADKE